jgi:hypothetical protein
VSTLLHATVYVFLLNLLNVLVHIANKMGLQKKFAPDGLSGSSSWCRSPNGAHDQILISLFDNYFPSYRYRAPSPIFPINRVIQPEVIEKSTNYVSVGRN